MKNYQYNLNTIAWLAIIALVLSLALSSCKKDKQIEPEPLPVPQSTIHYKCMSTFMWQYDEAIDIYVYGTTMSTVIKNVYNDTISYPNFHYIAKLTPYVIHGNVSISSNGDTLYLTYSNKNTVTNTTNYVTKAKYLKQ